MANWMWDRTALPLVRVSHAAFCEAIRKSKIQDTENSRL
jgi:hypothetical protein